MNYNDLLESHLKYGTTKEDIINKAGYKDILENVVIAPSWDHTLFNLECEKVSDHVYNLHDKDISFSFVEVKMFGASNISDYILALGVTKCKNLIFIGSTGSLDKDIKIGDIVIPEYSICGDGSSRYLNKDLKDTLFEKEYPSKDITNKLIRILEKENIKYHYVPNFSVDSIFTQYYHLDKIMDMGAKTIEMETAYLFKASKILNINTTAIFSISDNTILNSSVYSGRSEEDRNIHRRTKKEIIPKVIIELFKNEV